MPIINLVYEAPEGWKPGANTLAYYTFDSQNLNDSSGNNNNGSWYNGNGSFVQDGNGYCANLGGSYSIALPFTIAGLTNWTLNIYMKVNGNKEYNGILGTKTWNTGTMHINYTSNGISLAVKSYVDLVGSGALTIGSWYNICITKTGTTYSIYRNGALLNSGTMGNFTDTSTLYLGMTYETARCLNGYLDNVIFEDKARTQSEISAYYNQTKGNYGL